MSTLTKLALGLMGQLRPEPPKGDAAKAIHLPPPAKSGGLPLMEALAKRQSAREFVREAPLDLVFVADHARMGMVPVSLRESYASAAAGAIAQNVYFYCASAGLATVICAWIDRAAIADALGLTHDQQVLLAQTVGFPA